MPGRGRSRGGRGANMQNALNIIATMMMGRGRGRGRGGARGRGFKPY